MPKNILVAGGKGQIARALSETALPDDLRVTSHGRPELDILSPASIERVLERVRPDFIVNAAAYTAVDQAETDVDAAFALNETAAGALAAAASRRSIPIIHLSTDYVFDGTKADPYREDDPVAPLGVYGASKLAGERAVAAANSEHLILRTAWVYSPFGKNFVKTMLRVGHQRNALDVVDDQIGNPTSAHDIASVIVQLAKQILSGQAPLKAGVYHLSGSGSASWADFADKIFYESTALGGPVAQVRRILSSEYPTPVKRPANSRLDCTKLNDTYGVTMPAWQKSVQTCVGRLLHEGTWSS